MTKKNWAQNKLRRTIIPMETLSLPPYIVNIMFDVEFYDGYVCDGRIICGHYHQTEISRCNGHGVFLDLNKWDTLITFLRK